MSNYYALATAIELGPKQGRKHLPKHRVHFWASLVQNFPVGMPIQRVIGTLAVRLTHK